MLRIALFTTLMFGVNVNAHAQDTPEPTESASDADSAVTSRDSNERSTNMEVGLRLRSMSIPRPFSISGSSMMTRRVGLIRSRGQMSRRSRTG